MTVENGNFTSHPRRFLKILKCGLVCGQRYATSYPFSSKKEAVDISISTE